MSFDECINAVNSSWKGKFNHGYEFNKAVAELYASEKIKRAIELARETHNSLFIAEEDLIYTPEEILELVNKT